MRVSLLGYLGCYECSNFFNVFEQLIANGIVMDGQNGVAVLKHVQRELELGPEMNSKLPKMVENLVLAKKLNLRFVIMDHVLVRFWKNFLQKKT